MTEAKRGADAATRCRRRQAVVDAIRRHFAAAGFIEVDTPVLITAPAPEPAIDAPAVLLRGLPATVRSARFLQTSPELSMKRLLAAGLSRIYQLAPVFRDNDFGPLHRPEFRLLEWYRRDAGIDTLYDDCEALLQAAAAAAQTPGQLWCGSRPLCLRRPFARASVAALFVKHAGFDILEANTVAALQQRLAARGLPWAADDSWDDLFHRVFLTYIDPVLQRLEAPIFVTDYPAPLASLARLRPDEPRVAERFELFAGGIELANGFGELVNPVEQRARFAHDRSRRRAAGKLDYPLDEAFLHSLGSLPASAGIALGLERLLMLVYGATDMAEVACIPWELV